MTTTTTKGSAGTQILDELKELRQDIQGLADRALNPNDIRFFRASTKDVAIGKALKVDLRITVGYNERGYPDPKKTDGGVFLEITPQKTLKTRDRDATFDWESDQRVVSKLGIPDVSTILYAIRSRRFRTKVPDKLLAKGQDGSSRPGVFSMFHKAPARADRPASTSSIEYHVIEDGTAKIGISKSATLRKDIVLSPIEEIQLETYLLHALGQMQSVGL